MKYLLTFLFCILVTSNAYGANSKGHAAGYPMYCNEVLEGHARYEVKGGTWSGNHTTHRVMGYIQGYVTAHNKWKAGKVDWYKGTVSYELMNWVASYCRSNPEHALDQALQKFTK